MLEWSIAIGVLIAAVIIWIGLFKRKHPDQLVLIERKGEVFLWKKAFYPKPFCLSLPSTVRSISTEVKTQAKGKLDAAIKLVITFYADPGQITNMIRIGGWTVNALSRIEKELAGTAQGIVGEIVEPLDITEMTREVIAKNMKNRLDAIGPNLGIKITAVTVTSAEAVDRKLAEAIKQREEARIQEDTERAVQASRIAQAEMKSNAERKIAESEHQIALKKYELRKIEEEKAAVLAKAAVEQQTERRRLELAVEKDEVEMLTKNPSMLLLAPQLTRLTEASQQLKNAETVITLSSDIFNKLPLPVQQILNSLKTETKSGE